jgi:hypothetical protein
VAAAVLLLANHCLEYTVQITDALIDSLHDKSISCYIRMYCQSLSLSLSLSVSRLLVTKDKDKDKPTLVVVIEYCIG